MNLGFKRRFIFFCLFVVKTKIKIVKIVHCGMVFSFRVLELKRYL